MDPQAQGRFEGGVGGQQAKKAQGRTLTDPVERFAKPLLHLDTPVSASFVTPTSIHLFSGQDTSVSAQGDVHSTSAHSFSAVSGQTTSLYTHSGGIKAITANAGLSLRAHTDAQQIWSEKDLTVQSTTDEIRIQASKSITLTAGQSQIVIEGGNITFTCPGTWTVKGASHDWSGGGSRAAQLDALPLGQVGKLNHFIEVERLYHDGSAVQGAPVTVKFADGSLRRAVLDAAGKARIEGVASGIAAIEVGEDARVWRHEHSTDELSNPAYGKKLTPAQAAELYELFFGEGSDE
jgi:type VI secretion system secreted protein VgrG